MRQRRAAPLAALGVALLTACGPASPTPGGSPSAGSSATPEASPTPGIGEVVPAPGSESAVYRPNPGALVVVIDPGHGGCLDWGVPDPQQRGAAFAEKTMTLAIARRLRDLLVAEGVTVLLTHYDDVALAGDLYPDLGCTGAEFRDVNGDGLTGFGPEVTEGVRSRDELQARLDLANLARADLLLSIHINAITQGGVVFEIAASQTFYTDETPWGLSATLPLATDVQDEVVDALSGVASYERQDRGVGAVNLFVVAPPLFVPTEERPDPAKQPTRGALMPSVLSEVGSITLPAEHDLLLSDAGQAAVAEGLLAGLARWFAARSLAARMDALVPGGVAGVAPAAVEGDGPMFWATPLDGEVLSAGLHVRLTNTGSDPWPAGMTLLAGWEVSDQPYLRVPPAVLEGLDVALPGLGPGESVELVLPAVVPDCAQRTLLWLSLDGPDGPLSEAGSPALQLACGP